MKTIIINTSKKATDTKLDILFKAPYDQNTLLWFNVAPEKLDTVPQLTNQALITEADVVERDYNLVLLINLLRAQISCCVVSVCVPRESICRRNGEIRYC